MRAEQFFLEKIFDLNPIEDIYKAIGFSRILFSKNRTKFYHQLELIDQIENDIYEGISLKVCFDLYYFYRNQGINHVIAHRTKKGKIVKIPMYDLRDSMRKIYFSIIEIIYNSGLMDHDNEIGESGNTSYNEVK